MPQGYYPGVRKFGCSDTKSPEFFPDLCLARNISSLQGSVFFFGDFHLAFIIKIKNSGLGRDKFSTVSQITKCFTPELQTDYKRVFAFEPGVPGENTPLTTLLQLC